jgi:hypothetical protein
LGEIVAAKTSSENTDGVAVVVAASYSSAYGL